MSYVKKKTVLPVYLVGIVWLMWALLGQLCRPVHFIMAALVSAIAYFGGKMIWPDRGYEMKETGENKQAAKEAEPPKSRYSPEIQALISERDKALSEMARLNESIRDETISAQIDRMELSTQKIIDTVVADPDKQPQIRKFMNYYLPTTLKLLNAYDRMDSTGASGANIDGTKGKIEDMLDTVCKAFDNQLDALYGDEALDISTDITVMEQMLAREGLGSMQMPAAGEPSAECSTGEDGITLTL